MGIELKLDTKALQSLIDSDASFRLELQSAVISNVTRRYIKSLNTDVEAAIRRAAELAKEEAVLDVAKYECDTRGWNKKLVLHPTIINNVKQLARDAFNEEVRAYISTQLKGDCLTDLKKVIDVSVDQAMNRYIRESVKEQIEQRFNAAMKEATK